MKYTLVLATLIASGVAQAATPDSRHDNLPNGFAESAIQWKLFSPLSDEFNAEQLDSDKWDNAPRSLNVGAWSFDPNNAYIKDGLLVIETTQDTHTRRFADSCRDGVAGGKPQFVDRTFYYKSGAVRMKTETVYGFYEARIKGVELFPGLSPAFWLYSDGHPYPDRGNSEQQYVDYSEIDIVELQQADWRAPNDVDDQYDMDHNLHARVEENGRLVWKRPKAHPEDQLLHYRAPFDPGKGFHTYAVENRPDRITWYVDGVKVGSKPNKWWHRPMRLTLSQGLRRHLIKYNPGCQRADPNPDNVITAGFPEQARMQVEYVKTWKAQPSIWFEGAAAVQANVYSRQKPLDVEVGYHAGSDYHLVAASYQGLTVQLVEKNAQGVEKTIAMVSDTQALGDDYKYAGSSMLQLVAENSVLSDELPQGHYYALVASFSSSNGSDVYSNETPITLID
ncbi:family 16 glycosylhydrolase [Aliagarivorans marinus]|uniref:family 16 glycosylhydrolase n=1 Tax=Aliagarivorans marinus TaxID=561965 RepID=UPI0004079EE6|nr:family 16 glycosylhydrolase [Aliagarivorans marinus]